MSALGEATTAGLLVAEVERRMPSDMRSGTR